MKKFTLIAALLICSAVFSFGGNCPNGYFPINTVRNSADTPVPITCASGSGDIYFPNLAANALSNGAGAISGGSPNVTLGGTSVSNPKWINLELNANVGTGNIDLLDSSTGSVYVVPVGKVAFISQASVFNGNASSSTVFIAAKISGSYFAISTTTVGLITGNTLGIASTFVLQAGEGLALNTTVATQNVWVQVLEIDATVNIKFGRITALALGDNTLYTTPIGKRACIVSGSNAFILNGGIVSVINNSGGAVTIGVNIVNSGGSPTASNKLRSQADSNLTRIDTQVNACLSAGDFISVNSSSGTAGQVALVIVSEF